MGSKVCMVGLLSGAVRERSALDRLERALALGGGDLLAAALGYELPGIALVIAGRGARAAGAGARCAIVLACLGDAVALLHRGLLLRGCGAGGETCGDAGGQR